MSALRPIHRVLAIRSTDRVLHHVAPLGLAAAAAPCLVIDLDPSAPAHAPRSLADLLREGVTSKDLEVSRGSVAVVSNGGVARSEARELVDQLVERWPTVVVRVGQAGETLPTVDVEPLLPEPLGPALARSVLQRTLAAQRVDDDRCSLPPLRRSQIDAMVKGRIEPRWRWVRAWRQVWSRAWD